MSEQIYVEKLVVFHLDSKGEFQVSLFGGDFIPGVKYFRLKIPVPAELIGAEVIAEVEKDEQAAT